MSNNFENEQFFLENLCVQMAALHRINTLYAPQKLPAPFYKFLMHFCSCRFGFLGIIVSEKVMGVGLALNLGRYVLL